MRTRTRRGYPRTRPIPKCLNRGEASARLGPLSVTQDAAAVGALGAIDTAFASSLVLRRLPAPSAHGGGCGPPTVLVVRPALLLPFFFGAFAVSGSLTAHCRFVTC